MSWRLRFNLFLTLALALGITGGSLLVKTTLQDENRQTSVNTARLLMAAAEGVRSYTMTFVKPELEQRLSVEFLPQTVPAFAATESILALRKQFPEYGYKEAVLNPTNPRDRTTDWEADIVTSFRNDTNLKEIVGERAQGPIQSLYVAKPIKIENAACLACHTTASIAPASMVRMYGDSNGFGWKLNEIVGAKIVSVPVSVAGKEESKATLKIVLLLICLGVLALAIANILATPPVSPN